MIGIKERFFVVGAPGGAPKGPPPLSEVRLGSSLSGVSRREPVPPWAAPDLVGAGLKPAPTRFHGFQASGFAGGN